MILKEALINWVSDEYNTIADPGHRRWCLNPTMGSTGFGMVGAFSSMYAFDRSNFEAVRYVGVAWPAEQMPINYFNTDIQWSVSFGRRISQESVDVTLVKKDNQKTWRFNDKQADGKFFVSNAGYGQQGCVVFQPKDVKSYKTNDIYHVTIKENGNVIADYDVRFFDLVKTPSKVKLVTLKTVKNGHIKANWTKTACTGYQIRCSSSKNFKSYKTITVKSENTLIKTIKNLTKGRTYYVKVRAYNEGFDKRVYGSFSTARKVKCR